jgi:hypothetical protein
MSIPLICRTATTQAVAASPSVAVSAVAVAASSDLAGGFSLFLTIADAF